MAKTILVVDDSANVRTLVRDYLTAEGFRVAIASNGRQALFVARDEKPDLILLDIMMPEMDGFEFIRAYRKESDTPVILLTATYVLISNHQGGPGRGGPGGMGQGKGQFAPPQGSAQNQNQAPAVTQ